MTKKLAPGDRYNRFIAKKKEHVAKDTNKEAHEQLTKIAQANAKKVAIRGLV